jgi:hypothetical protein
MIKGAVFEGKRRYRLWRIWEPQKPLLLYVLLNPSHADADANDRTVAKLIQFTKNGGYGGFYLGNIHSYITSNPKKLIHHLIPDEKANIGHLKAMKSKCEKVVFGWGNAAEIPHWIKPIIDRPYCFGINHNGSPKHPLYLSYQTRLVPFHYQMDPLGKEKTLPPVSLSPKTF